MGRDVVGIYRRAFTPVVPDNTIRLVVVSVGVYLVTPCQIPFFGRGPSTFSPLSNSCSFFSYQFSARKVAFFIALSSFISSLRMDVLRIESRQRYQSFEALVLHLSWLWTYCSKLLLPKPRAAWRYDRE
jgi:hypothetical protein